MNLKGMTLVAGAVMAVLLALSAQAAIPGETGPNFNFTAKSGYISTPEGGRLFILGYAKSRGKAQYPGPTMIVNQGDTVTVTLTNQIDTPVSMVFPGQTGVTAQAVSGSTVARKKVPFAASVLSRMSIMLSTDAAVCIATVVG